MSLKRECDRCQHLALANSVDGREMRVVRVERDATGRLINGGATILTTDYDLCRYCLNDLGDWIHTAPDRVEEST